MLAQRTLGASVCLRCRLNQARLLRLGRAPVVPLAATTTISSSSAATFTSIARRLQANDPFDVSEPLQPDIRRVVADHDPIVPVIRIVPSNKRDKNDAPAEGKPRNKHMRRGRKGQTMKETSAPLQREYLGETSEVLILRDLTPLPEKKQKRRDALAAAPEEEDEAARRRREIRETIKASIAGQSAVPGQEEINEQIYKLRPKSTEGPQYPVFITREQVKGLRKALKDAYSVPQLRRYVSVQEGWMQLGELKREERAEQGALWLSAWQPGVSPIEKRLSDPETDDVPVDKLPKMQVVDRILSKLWNVGVVEESEAVGEIEIKLEPWQFDLIITLKRGRIFSILDNIGHQREVRVDSYRPENILRVTGERENSEQAITDIKRELRQFTVMRFNLNDFESLRQKRGLERLMDFFSQKDLEVAARLSNTIIDSSSDSSVVICGASDKTVELARRILLTMIGPPTGAKTSTLAEAEGEGFLQSCAFESALHYRHRKKNYGRWTFPIQRDSTKEEKNQVLDEEPPSETLDGATTTSTEAQSDHLPGDGTTEARDADGQPQLAEKITQYFNAPLDVLNDASEGADDSVEESRASYWEPSALTEFYATFGNVLHKSPPTNDSLSPVSLPNLLEHDGNPSRVFLHTVPGFSPFLQHIAENTQLNRHVNDQKNSDALLFRFMPSPWDLEDPSSLEDFPDLGLRMQFNKHTGKARFQGLGLTVRERNMDVLMPEKPVDVRFTQREVLWTHKILDRSDEIRDYLTQIGTTIDFGGTVRAPPTLKLRIPAWTVRDSEKYSSLPVEYTERGKEYVKQFIFTTVEHRQMVKYELPDSDTRVSFTSVEGGRLGGRRGELRLRLRRPARDVEQLQAQVPRLVDGALNVASTIEDAVHNRLQLPERAIKKIGLYGKMKRLTPEGFQESVSLHPGIRYMGGEGGKNVELGRGKDKQTTSRAKKANGGSEESHAPLKAGAN